MRASVAFHIKGYLILRPYLTSVTGYILTSVNEGTSEYDGDKWAIHATSRALSEWWKSGYWECKVWSDGLDVNWERDIGSLSRFTV